MKMLYQMESQGDFSDGEKESFLYGFVSAEIADRVNAENREAAFDGEEDRPALVLSPEIARSLDKYIDTGYFDAAFDAYIYNNNTIDDLIEKYSKGWKIDRIARVDLAVLRVSVTEMLFLKAPAVPQAVSINEAVNLAKLYGSEDSGKFVNGILGRIAREESPFAEKQPEAVYETGTAEDTECRK